MKKISSLLFLFLSFLLFAQDIPKILKKDFSKEALSQSLQNTEGKKLTMKDILKKHEGKIIVLDFWASWCRDCLNALPKAKILEDKNSSVDFVYFSLDKTEESWKKGLQNII